MPPERELSQQQAENRERPKVRRRLEMPRQETPNVPVEREVAQPITQVRLREVLERPLIAEMPPLDLRSAQPPEEPEVQMTEITDEELGYQPTFFNRLAKNKLARGVMTLFGLAGAAKGAASSVESLQEYDRQAEVQQEIISVAYESVIDLTKVPDFKYTHQLYLTSEITLDDGSTTSRLDALDALGTQFTVETKDLGLNGLARNIADKKFLDGSKGIDIFRFNLAYGDQIHLAPEALEALGRVVDLSPAELDIYSKIIRTSVLERADMGNGLFYHDSDQFNVNQAPEKPKAAHRARFESALQITREAIKSLDVERQTPNEQQQTIKNIAGAIRETIEAENAWTQAAGYTQDWQSSGLKEAFATDFAPRLLAEADEAELAWKQVAALEEDPDGQLHALAEAVSGKLENKAKAFFTKALQIDPNDPSLAAGLEHFSR